LLTDQKGNLWLTDKGGNLLEGWNPRALTGRMIRSSRHYRVFGKDYFMAIQQNGIVNLLNRRGEMVRGFPLNLDLRPIGDYFITIGKSLSSSFFTVVSDDGLKVQFGFDGQIRKKEVLIKRVGSSVFSLVRSKMEDSYVFLRVDPGKLAILDPDGKIIFENENPGSTSCGLSYIENRLKERYYCLYDSQQNFSYIFDSTGQLVLSEPLESTQPPTLNFDEKSKTLSIYNAFDANLSLISIKK
jgi:hypothetical protein